MKRIKLNSNDDLYCDYLTDSSLFQGHAESLVFCHSTEEVKQLLLECYHGHIPLTLQGSRTGLCGGATPKGGCILNLSEMSDITGLSYDNNRDTFFIKVSPGLSLNELNEALMSKKMNTSNWSNEDQTSYELFKKSSSKFFPPDPTESLASIGGMVACDASGACSFKYGSTRHHVESLKVVTFMNEIPEELTINRGHYTYEDINALFNHDNFLPKWHRHNSEIKDCAGFYYDDGMDLIDLMIGGEGLLGVITEITLKLSNTPDIKMGLILFLDKKDKMVEFIDWLRGDIIGSFEPLITKPSAIEYFDKNTFEMLNSFRSLKTEINQLPKLSEAYEGGLYIEFHLNEETILDKIMVQLLDQLKYFNLNEREQWLAIEPSDYEKLKNFRHSVPECVNILVANQKKIEPSIKKVGTDMAVPNGFLNKVLEMYEYDMLNSNLKTIVFGHIGNNHLHVNMIPIDKNEYNRSLELLTSWAGQVIKHGGTISAEHGIGKLKKDMLRQMMTEEDIKSMKVIKKIIEPSGLINQGNCFD